MIANQKSVFFIVGAAKSGTSSINRYLDDHPEVHMCPKKDVACYFCRHYGLSLTLDEYKEMLLPRGSYKVAGDCCHAYLTDGKSAEWIKREFPDAKIIMILRNPADKAFSQYHWLVSHGYEYIESFEDALAAEKLRIAKNPWKDFSLIQGYPPNYLYVQSSLYAQQIKHYQQYFSDDKLLFMTFDELKADSGSAMKRIYGFLGVDQNINLEEYKVFNKRKGVRSIKFQYFLVGKMSRILPSFITRTLKRLNTTSGDKITFRASTRKLLLNQFEDDIKETSRVTGLDLKCWLEDK